MERQTASSGLGNLLGLAVIALIIGSAIYSVWGVSEPVQEQPVEQPQVVQQQPQTTTTDQIFESLGLGDGKLSAAQTLAASDIGKPTAISGGGFTGGSGSSSSTSRRSSSQPSTPPRRSGG